MRWDAVLHPVGPLPVATYWMRRAIAVGSIIAVIIVLGLIAGAVGGSKSSSKPAGASVAIPTAALTGASKSTVTAAPSSAAPLASIACTDDDLKVAIKTGAASYPSSSLPQFVVTVTNTGSLACKRDLGAKATVITVLSGSDRIWSSGDCPSSKSAVRRLAAGASVTVTSSWDRDRSVVGCATTGAAGEPARAGVYVASVKLGTLAAPGTASFHLS